MFGGTVLVEMIFAYPGLGNLMVDAVRNHDLPSIQAVALVYCVLVLGDQRGRGRGLPRREPQAEGGGMTTRTRAAIRRCLRARASSSGSC